MMAEDNQPWGFRFFRGINAEVSMPTGSLCSERNAIGSALAQCPSIRRDNFAAIAVLSLHHDAKTMSGGKAKGHTDAGRKRRAEEFGDAPLSPWRLKRWRSNSETSPRHMHMELSQHVNGDNPSPSSSASLEVERSPFRARRRAYGSERCRGPKSDTALWSMH